MRIQSKRVWIADAFVPAILEFSEQKIVNILPYGRTLLIFDSLSAKELQIGSEFLNQ